MQLEIDLSIIPLEKTHYHTPSIITCGICWNEKECFELVPTSNGEIDCYCLGLLMFICENCYHKNNKDNILDECLLNYNRLKYIKEQQYKLREEVLKTSFTAKRSLLTEKHKCQIN